MRAGLLAVVLLGLLALPGTARAVVGTPVTLPEPSPQVRIAGSGWGHSVGMSQYGAYAQALKGWSSERILRYWYPGVDVTRDGASDQPIVVNLSTAATSPDIVVEEGTARWQVCTPRCTWMTDSSGARVNQRAGTAAFTVVATTGGELTVRQGSTVRWRGTTGATLRVQLSADGQRTVARVLGQRYRRGTLELSSGHGAACAAPALCVNVRVPSVDTYLYGLAEMPSSWAGTALAAQATVGRTYALRMLDRGLRTSCRCHLLATPADQVYAGLAKEEGFSGERWVAQVDATARQVVRYRGALAATFYASSHGGRTERVEDSYAYSAPTADYPYLESVDDPFSADPAVANPYARWTVGVANDAFARFVDPDLQRVTGVSVRSRTAGGTPRMLLVSGVDRAGEPLVVEFDGVVGKPVGSERVFIAGVELKQRFGLRSQQISRIGLAPFSDDDGNVHEYAIATLAAADVTSGCAADRYCPTEAVSRAQTAALLVRALRLPGSDVDAFADDGGSVHEPAINALAAAGLANGCTATEPQGRRSATRVAEPASATYCPGGTLTRGQMASLLARALELPAASTDAFPDDDGTEHEHNINRLAAAGITTGQAGGGFGPSDGVTRAQMASFLVRALRYAT